MIGLTKVIILLRKRYLSHFFTGRYTLICKKAINIQKNVVSLHNSKKGFLYKFLREK